LFAEAFLLDSFTVIENIAIPFFKISGADIDSARERTRSLLDFIGLRELANAAIRSLSLFDQHLVALARALVHRPEILIIENADVHLSGDELGRFLSTVRRVNSEFQTMAILSGSMEMMQPLPGRVIELRDGGIHDDTAPVAAKFREAI